MNFATREESIAHLAEGVRGLADTWQDTSGQGAGMWGAEVPKLRLFLDCSTSPLFFL